MSNTFPDDASGEDVEVAEALRRSLADALDEDPVPPLLDDDELVAEVRRESAGRFAFLRLWRRFRP
jgi:hypothetical protein